MNSAKNVNITDQASTVLACTQEHWSCAVPSTPSPQATALEPASTTEPGVHAGKKHVSLKPSDPYPTWPFTQVEPKSLEQWCKKNLKPVYQIEEALF